METYQLNFKKNVKNTKARLHDKAFIGLIIAVFLDKAQNITYKDNYDYKFEDIVKLIA